MTEDCRQELLPCPFCGGEAKIESKQGSFGYSNAHHSVTCVSCGVSTPRVGERYPAAEAEREAIKAASVQWNRRASVPAPEVTEEMVKKGSAGFTISLHGLNNSVKQASGSPATWAHALPMLTRPDISEHLSRAVLRAAWNTRASIPEPEVTDEMVERAAKAMFDNVYHAAQVPESDWYAIWLREAAYHKTLARVALNTALKGTV